MGSHAVLGAAGQMGRLLVPELQRRGHTVGALSRDWQGTPYGDAVEHRAADVLDFTSLTAATEGADVLYAVVGLPYSTRVWQRDWPPAMRNLIAAVEANGCKLVFMDNVYAYGLVAGAMTEATAYNPCSRKGEVRAQSATELMDADKTGWIVATIGRSADFYGPEALLSTFGERFFKGALDKGKAEWLCSTETLHTFNYTPDNARALATLGRGGRCERQGLAPPFRGGTTGRPLHRPRRRATRKTAQATSAEPQNDPTGQPLHPSTARDPRNALSE